MCPLWPLHLIIIYLLALCPLWMLCEAAPSLMAKFYPTDIIVHMEQYQFIDVNVTGSLQVGDKISLQSQQDYIAVPSWNSSQTVSADDAAAGLWRGKMRVDGQYLGHTSIELKNSRGSEELPINGSYPVTVTRPKRVIDTIFTTSVILFVSLIFINFGCAMHWPTVKEVIRRPVGPLIGMAGQFVFMPLITFGLGYLIFPNDPGLHLGMFFTGVSPAGGASNIWTFILGGNLNLSLAMTTLSTICSFALMPAWLFSLGQVVFLNANIQVPYQRILFSVMGLLIPLAIGLAMQKFTPRLAAFMVRILKGFSTILLLGIIVFAIVTNLYIFKLFTWQIIVAGMGVPWLGYVAGYVMARVFRQSHPDSLAISIETGIQNTGIAILLLRNALQQPLADISTVIPVSVAIMTPIPMMFIYFYQKIRGCVVGRKKFKQMDKESGALSPSVAVIDVGQ